MLSPYVPNSVFLVLKNGFAAYDGVAAVHTAEMELFIRAILEDTQKKIDRDATAAKEEAAERERQFMRDQERWDDDRHIEHMAELNGLRTW